MPVNIGPKIGLDGEGEFRKSLQQINTQLKTLGTEMKAVTSAFDANDNSQEALSAQTDVLNRQLQVQQQRLSEIQKALDFARANYAENSNEVQKWQQALNNATTDINKTKNQLSQLESRMDGTADSADDMGTEIEDAGDAAESSGGKLSSFAVTVGNLASSAITSAIDGIKNLASSLWNLDETTEEYRVAQGRLNTAFEAAGYSSEAARQAYSAFYGILGDTDTATEASQLLAQLADNEQDMANWTQIAAGVAGTFGDSLPIEGLIEAANETANVGTVTGTLADALNWVGISEDQFNTQLASCSDEGERNRLIMDTLSGAYSDASDAFYENNAALVESRENQAALDEAMSTLGTNVVNVKNQLLSQFVPGLADVATAFSGVISGTEGADIAFTQSIQGMITSLVAALPQFLTMGTSILQNLMSGISAAMPAIAAIIPQIVQAFMSILPQAIVLGVQILTSLISGIIQAIPDLVAALPTIIEAIIAGLLELLPQILEMGMVLLEELTNGILEYLPTLIERIPQIIDDFLAFLTDQLPTILDKGSEILLNLANGIINAIPQLVSQLPQIIASITGFIANNLPKIVETGIEILLQLAVGIIKAIPQLVSQLPQIITGIVTGIRNLLSGVIGVGREIVEGIWQGIKNAASWLVSKITGWFNSVVNSVKNFLGIASPSKLFADEVGKNMALGVGVGWDKEIDTIARDMQNSLPTPTIDTINNAAAGMVNGMATVSSNQRITVEVPLYIDGKEFFRATLQDLRAVQRSSPEVLSGV